MTETQSETVNANVILGIESVHTTNAIAIMTGATEDRHIESLAMCEILEGLAITVTVTTETLETTVICETCETHAIGEILVIQEIYAILETIAIIETRATQETSEMVASIGNEESYLSTRTYRVDRISAPIVGLSVDLIVARNGEKDSLRSLRNRRRR